MRQAHLQDALEQVPLHLHATDASTVRGVDCWTSTRGDDHKAARFRTLQDPLASSEAGGACQTAEQCALSESSALRAAGYKRKRVGMQFEDIQTAYNRLLEALLACSTYGNCKMA